MNRTFIFPILTADAIDGDTVRCTVDLGFHLSRRVDVRLLGVDAPEMHGVSRDAAQVVRQSVQVWLGDGGRMELHSAQLDKFGRVLGDIFDATASCFLTDALRSSGYAKPTSPTGKREPWTQAELDHIAKKNQP